MMPEEFDKPLASEGKQRAISTSELIREEFASMLPELPGDWEQIPGSHSPASGIQAFQLIQTR